jgi:hypothetical protein
MSQKIVSYHGKNTRKSKQLTTRVYGSVFNYTIVHRKVRFLRLLFTFPTPKVHENWKEVNKACRLAKAKTSAVHFLRANFMGKSNFFVAGRGDRLRRLHVY